MRDTQKHRGNGGYWVAVTLVSSIRKLRRYRPVACSPAWECTMWWCWNKIYSAVLKRLTVLLWGYTCTQMKSLYFTPTESLVWVSIWFAWVVSIEKEVFSTSNCQGVFSIHSLPDRKGKEGQAEIQHIKQTPKQYQCTGTVVDIRFVLSAIIWVLMEMTRRLFQGICHNQCVQMHS